jgi:uncharacterized protein (TIGR03067 family)
MTEAELKTHSTMTIEGDRLSFAGGDCTIRLDADKKPKEIDLFSDDTRGRRGIYSLEGDTLKVCLSDPGVPRPRTFETDKQGRNMLLELRRQPGPAEPPPPPRDDSIRQFTGHESIVKAVAFSPDGRYALSGSGFPDGSDRSMRLWDVKTGKQVRRYGRHVGPVQSVAFSPKGDLVASGSADQTVRLFNWNSDQEVRRFTTPKQTFVNSIAFTRDGHLLLAGGDGTDADNLVRLWDVADGQEVRRFKGHRGFVTSVALSSDDRRALTGSQDQTARLWDVATGKELLCLKGHTALVEGVAFSPDGRHAATCSVDWSVRLWDLQTGQEVRQFPGHMGPVRSVAFSPDGTRLLTGGQDMTVRLWEVRTGQELRCLRGHTAGVWSVAFSRDGQQALSGSADRTLRLWQLSGDWVPLFNGKDLRLWQLSGNWVPLFNGKDLTGWKPLPAGVRNWRVENGVLIGAGRLNPTYLITERGDYVNFQVRAEARINVGGNSGLYFRAGSVLQPNGHPAGYEAQINSSHGDPIRTGSLYGFGPRGTVTDTLVKPGEWFTLEVIADGNHLVIKVNGRTTVDLVDEKTTYRRGHFALQQLEMWTVAEFRKIEVRELPRK